MGDSNAYPALSRSCPVETSNWITEMAEALGLESILKPIEKLKSDEDWYFFLIIPYFFILLALPHFVFYNHIL